MWISVKAKVIDVFMSDLQCQIEIVKENEIMFKEHESVQCYL